MTASRLRRRLVVLVLPACLLVPACSSSGSSATGDTTASDGGLDLASAVDLTGRATVEIAVKDNVYEPKVFKVDPGTKVTFTNQGNNAHNVIPVQDGAFPAIQTGSLDPGMSASITVGTPGDYRFYCSIHGSPNKGQRGAVVVATPRP